MSLATELLKEFEFQLSALELVPSRGGVFEVTLGERLLFSKKQLGRHAEPGEVRALLAAHLKPAE